LQVFSIASSDFAHNFGSVRSPVQIRAAPIFSRKSRTALLLSPTLSSPVDVGRRTPLATAWRVVERALDATIEQAVIAARQVSCREPFDRQARTG